MPAVLLFLNVTICIQRMGPRIERIRFQEGALHACTQEDSSVTRSDAYLLDLLKRAGYTLLGSALQRNFPKGLFKVRCYFSHRHIPRPLELMPPRTMSLLQVLPEDSKAILCAFPVAASTIGLSKDSSKCWKDVLVLHTPLLQVGRVLVTLIMCSPTWMLWTALL